MQSNGEQLPTEFPLVLRTKLLLTKWNRLVSYSPKNFHCGFNVLPSKLSFNVKPIFEATLIGLLIGSSVFIPSGDLNQPSFVHYTGWSRV